MDGTAVHSLPISHRLDAKQCENASVRRKAVLEALSEADSTSQRLVLGADRDFSLDHIVDRAFGVRFHLPFDAGFREDLPAKINRSFPYGIGGIALRPSLLMNFSSIGALNAYIYTSVDRMRIRAILETGACTIQVTLLPWVFMDWNAYREGYNASLASHYTDAAGDKDFLVTRMAVNGVFGPQVDYHHGIEAELPRLEEFVRVLNAHGIITFAKHFGYRADYRRDSHGVIPTNGRVDVHEEVVREVTPLRQFVSEDMAVLDQILQQGTANAGIMVGHHVLEAIDPERPASLSPKVFAYLRRRFGESLLTISDSLDMKGAAYGSAGGACSTPADLILVIHPEAWERRDYQEGCGQAMSSSRMERKEILRRILESKMRMGLMEVDLADARNP